MLGLLEVAADLPESRAYVYAHLRLTAEDRDRLPNQTFVSCSLTKDYWALITVIYCNKYQGQGQMIKSTRSRDFSGGVVVAIINPTCFFLFLHPKIIGTCIRLLPWAEYSARWMPALRVSLANVYMKTIHKCFKTNGHPNNSPNKGNMSGVLCVNIFWKLHPKTNGACTKEDIVQFSAAIPSSWERLLIKVLNGGSWENLR